MTQMKPRQMFTAASKGQISEVSVRGEWYPITAQSLTLIGSRSWTIWNGPHADGVKLTVASGNESFEVR